MYVGFSNFLDADPPFLACGCKKELDRAFKANSYILRPIANNLPSVLQEKKALIMRDISDTFFTIVGVNT